MNKDDKEAEAKAVKDNMAHTQDSQSGSRPGSGPGSGSGRRAPAVLDRWFDAQLGRLYSDVAAEPVPVEMLQLISKLKKPKKPGE